jgi:cytidylate kinase
MNSEQMNAIDVCLGPGVAAALCRQAEARIAVFTALSSTDVDVCFLLVADFYLRMERIFDRYRDGEGS